MLSTIRAVGLVLGLLIIVFGLVRRRGGAASRGELLLFMASGGGLCLVSVFPGVVEAFRFFKDQSRVVSLMVIGQLLTLMALLGLYLRGRRTDAEVGRLIHALAVKGFESDLKAGVEKEGLAGSVLVVIPAYNEADNLPRVLAHLPEKIADRPLRALVAVDGATDDTEAVVRERNLPLAVNIINRGGGAALKVGYELARAVGAEVVVTMDADGQHLPEEMAGLVEPILEGRADLVSGSRILGRADANTLAREMGIAFFNRLISLLLLRRITDSSNGYRAIRVSRLAELELSQKQFHSSELLIEAVSRGLRYEEAPVTVARRSSGESKKPRTLGYALGYARAIFKTWLRT